MLFSSQTKKLQKSFTLIELLVAVFIFSLGILGILTMFPLGAKIVRSSQRAAVATQLNQAKFENIISQSYQSIAVGNTLESPLPSPFSSFRRETTITYIDPGTGLTEVSTDKGIKKIEITVYWKSMFGVGEESIKIISLISQR